MEKDYDIIVEPGTPKVRLDIFLSKQIGISRSQVDKLIAKGLVKLNNAAAKSGYRVKVNDRLLVNVPEAKEIETAAENLPLNIVYEDKDIIVINKPRGIVVHPAAGNIKGTLVNALLYHCKDLSGIGGKLRPGVVHRLDKDTSGLIVFAKNDEAHANLSRQLKDRQFKKIYSAIVYGEVKNDKGIIDVPLGRHPVHRKKMAAISSGKLKSREALTYYRVIERFPAKGGSASGGKGYTLLELDLKTGRTHQIRVHLSYIGHPVVGDRTYSRRKSEFNVAGQLLHAKMLGFNHPITGKYHEFNAEIPEDMKRVLGVLVKDESGNKSK